MTKVQVYDPPMCCSTGVCGPKVDPVLPCFAADLEWLKSKGVGVERYNLSQQLAECTSNLLVKQTLHARGTKCLPMIFVDGELVSQAVYPTREQLATFTGVAYQPRPVFKQHQTDLVGIGQNLAVKK